MYAPDDGVLYVGKRATSNTSHPTRCHPACRAGRTTRCGRSQGSKSSEARLRPTGRVNGSWPLSIHHDHRRQTPREVHGPATRRKRPPGDGTTPLVKCPVAEVTGADEIQVPKSALAWTV